MFQRHAVEGRGRNNSRISYSQQDYLVGKFGSPAVILFGSPTKFLVVLGLPDYHYFDPWRGMISGVCQSRNMES